MSLRDEILADSPEIYFRLEETSGQHIDESGNGNDSTTVTVTGQGTADPGAGWAGAGLGDDFDGTDDFVGVPYSVDFFPGTGALPFSIFMVGKLDVIDTVFRRLLSWEDGTNGWNIHTQSGTNRKLTVERLGSGVTSAVGWNSAVINTVYMIHAVYDGSQLSLYANNVLRAGPTSSTQTMNDPGVALNLGRRVSDASRFLNGQIYEFAFFKTALSTTRIQAHWDARDDAGTGGQTIAVGVASETETAQTVTATAGTVTVTVTAATETESAEAITADAVVSVAVGAATETETAQVVAPVAGVVSISVGAATETESAETVAVVQGGGGQSINVSAAIESEAAETVTVAAGAVSITVTAATESEAAGTVTPVAGGAPQTVAVTAATETETAQTVTAVNVQTVGVAVETETAVTVGIIPGATSITVGVAIETETARPVTPIAGTEYDMVITHGGPTDNWRTGGLKGNWSTGTLSKRGHTHGPMKT